MALSREAGSQECRLAQKPLVAMLPVLGVEKEDMQCCLIKTSAKGLEKCRLHTCYPARQILVLDLELRCKRPHHAVDLIEVFHSSGPHDSLYPAHA